MAKNLTAGRSYDLGKERHNVMTELDIDPVRHGLSTSSIIFIGTCPRVRETTH